MFEWAVLAAVGLTFEVFGFFGRRRKVPHWAGALTLKQFDRFNRTVLDYWKKQGVPARIDDQTLFVNDSVKGEQQFGLSNLAQMCGQWIDQPQWEEFLSTHFTTMEEKDREIQEADERLEDFTWARPLLAVRIANYSVSRDQLVAREDLPGTLTYLCLDLPSSVVTVTPESAGKWGVHTDELFAIGLENVRANYVPELMHDEFEPGIGFFALTGQDFFVTTNALMLKRWDGFVGQMGSLVAIPHRHTLICHPINSANSVVAVHRMAMVAQGLEKEGPGSITPNLYWYDGSVFRVIECRTEGDKFVVKPPPEFIDALNKLAEESGELES